MARDISELTRDEITALAEADYAEVPRLRQHSDAWSQAAELARHVQSKLEEKLSQRLGTSDTESVRALLKQISGTDKSTVSLAGAAERRASAISDTADEAERLKTAIDRLNGEAAEAAGSHAADPDIAFQGYGGISDPQAGYQAYLADVTDDMRSEVRLTSNAYEDRAREHADAPVHAFAGPGEWTGPMPERMPETHPAGDSRSGVPVKSPIDSGSGPAGGDSGYTGEGAVGSSASGSAPVTGGREPDLQSGPGPVTSPAPGGPGPAPAPSPGTGPGPVPVPVPGTGPTPGGGPVTGPAKPPTPPPSPRPTPGLNPRPSTGTPAPGPRPGPTLPGSQPGGPGTGTRPGQTAPPGTRPGTGMNSTPNRPGTGMTAVNQGGRPGTGPTSPTGNRPGTGMTAANAGNRPGTGPGSVPPGRTAPTGTGTASTSGGRTPAGQPPAANPRGTGPGGSAAPKSGPGTRGATPMPGTKAERALLPSQRGGPASPTPARPGANPAGNNPFTSSRSTVPPVVGGRDAAGPPAPGRTGQGGGSVLGARPGKAAGPKPKAEFSRGSLTRYSSQRPGAWTNAPRVPVAGTKPAGKVIGARSATPAADADSAMLRLRAQTRRKFLNDIDERKALAGNDSELLRGIESTVVPGVITAGQQQPPRTRRRDAGRVFGTGGWEG